jgi:predicted TIM-barrel fold metal-dependent hydrolase
MEFFMLFDTHLHLIYPDRLSYPWLESVPELNAPSTFTSYSKKAKRLGISGCLHMEVDVDPKQIDKETELISELMKEPTSILRGVISAARPENTKFGQFLEVAQLNKTIKGFRRVLHTQNDELSQSKIFRDNIKLLSNTDLTFDLCVLPHQLLTAVELVDYCPHVTFILNHCGVPNIKSGALSPWNNHISELAERPNVIAKISGLIAYGDLQEWGLDSIRPYFDHTVKAFGHNRIIWGSDSPVCNLGGGLETWVAATHALTADWSWSQRSRFYQDNAKSIWTV